MKGVLAQPEDLDLRLRIELRITNQKQEVSAGEADLYVAKIGSTMGIGDKLVSAGSFDIFDHIFVPEQTPSTPEAVLGALDRAAKKLDEFRKLVVDHQLSIQSMQKLRKKR